MVRSDWSILNCIIIGLVVEGLMFFILTLSASLSLVALSVIGGCISGCIARRNGWIAGTLLGMITFLISTLFLLHMAPQWEAFSRTHPHIPKVSVSQQIGQFMGLVPMGALGGYMGGLIRSVFLRCAAE